MTGDMRKPILSDSITVSFWMRENIDKVLKRKGFDVISLDVDSEVSCKDKIVNIINLVNVKYKDDTDELQELDYNSSNKDYNCDKDLCWLVDMIKELEMKAVLEFAGEMLNRPEKEVGPVKLVDVSKIEQLKKIHIKITGYFSCSVETLADVLTRDDLIRLWTFGTVRFTDDGFLFDNIEIKELCKTESAKNIEVTMKYKCTHWDEFSDVKVTMDQVGDNARVHVDQKGVPISDQMGVMNHWRQRVFLSICAIFKCVMKDM